MNVIDEFRESWGWIGLAPTEIVAENDFGNLILKDAEGKYWRFCPEDLYCEIVAQNQREMDSLACDQDFIDDWEMKALGAEARSILGELPAGMKYCLKVPGILGGEYGGSNLAMITFKELISFSGYVAEQIKDLPDGSQVEFQVTE